MRTLYSRALQARESHNAARVHPVVVIFCLLAGGTLFGVVGMILAVPAALLVKVTLSVIYREAR